MINLIVNFLHWLDVKVLRNGELFDPEHVQYITNQKAQLKKWRAVQDSITV